MKPTKRFFKFHGNYGGPGHAGGKPIDDLDLACYHHDKDYDNSKTEAARNMADERFIKRTSLISHNTKYPKVIREKAAVASTYFKL